MQGEYSEIKGNKAKKFTSFVKALTLNIHYLTKKTSYKDKETDRRKKMNKRKSTLKLNVKKELHLFLSHLDLT